MVILKSKDSIQTSSHFQRNSFSIHIELHHFFILVNSNFFKVSNLFFSFITKPKNLLAIFLIGTLIGILIVFGIDYWVKNNAKDKVFNEVSKIPTKKVGLLLGTSKFLKNGHKNLYYHYRILAATELYKNGKLNYILISGDNSQKEYNEPQMMKEDLIAKGIPENKIYLDYAGFRTLDSVIRAHKVFGQKEFIVISQQFHNERAIFLAESYNIKVIGFNAKDVSFSSGFKTIFREKLARVKMILDLIIQVQPKFLGKKIEIQ